MLSTFSPITSSRSITSTNPITSSSSHLRDQEIFFSQPAELHLVTAFLTLGDFVTDMVR